MFTVHAFSFPWKNIEKLKKCIFAFLYLSYKPHLTVCIGTHIRTAVKVGVIEPVQHEKMTCLKNSQQLRLNNI